MKMCVEKRDEDSICILSKSMERRRAQNDMKSVMIRLFHHRGLGNISDCASRQCPSALAMLSCSLVCVSCLLRMTWLLRTTYYFF